MISQLADNEVLLLKGTYQHSIVCRTARPDTWIHVLLHKETGNLSSEIILTSEQLPGAALQVMEAVPFPPNFLEQLELLALELQKQLQHEQEEI